MILPYTVYKFRLYCKGKLIVISGKFHFIKQITVMALKIIATKSYYPMEGHANILVTMDFLP